MALGQRFRGALQAASAPLQTNPAPAAPAPARQVARWGRRESSPGYLVTAARFCPRSSGESQRRAPAERRVGI